MSGKLYVRFDPSISRSGVKGKIDENNGFHLRGVAGVRYVRAISPCRNSLRQCEQRQPDCAVHELDHGGKHHPGRN